MTPDPTPGSTLPVVETFPSLQGEGANAGRAAYFIRLAGCDVRCPWCDTRASWDTAAYPRLTVRQIVDRALEHAARNVVLTGGEPLLHPLGPLAAALGEAGFARWLETSGTHPLSGAFEWLCLSPKPHREPRPELLARADELKVVVAAADDLAHAERWAEGVREGCLLELQPEWERHAELLPLILGYLGAHPRWRLSLQQHKWLGIR